MNVSGRRLYTANVSNVRLVYQFNKRSFLRTNIQYVDYRYNTVLYEDDMIPLKKKMFSQVLYSYKINPQTVFYLGYSDNYYGDHEVRFIRTNRTFFTKVGYAWMP